VAYQIGKQVLRGVDAMMHPYSRRNMCEEQVRNQLM